MINLLQSNQKACPQFSTQKEWSADATVAKDVAGDGTSFVRIWRLEIQPGPMNRKGGKSGGREQDARPVSKDTG